MDDFAKATPVQLVEPTLSLKVDGDDWKKTLESVTDLYRHYPEIQSVSASARFTVINDYMLNTEGTVTRNGKSVYTVQVNAATQAPDGMRLGRTPAWTVARLSELPNLPGTQEGFPPIRPTGCLPVASWTSWPVVSSSG